MLKIEFMKLKRSYLFLVMILTIIFNMIIQLLWGNMVYLGVAYHTQLGWQLDSGLSLSTYYLFTPIFTLFGSSMIEKEVRYGTWTYLRTIPIHPMQLLLVKRKATFIVAAAYSFLMFIGMATLESCFHLNLITAHLLLTYAVRYIIHGIGSFLIACLMTALSLHFKKSSSLAVIIAFLVSFLGIFTASTNLAQVYPINAIFFLSGVYEGTAWQRIIAALSLIACFLLSILLSRYAWKETDG